jgi:hypothetical protein
MQDLRAKTADSLKSRKKHRSALQNRSIISPICYKMRQTLARKGKSLSSVSNGRKSLEQLIHFA